MDSFSLVSYSAPVEKDKNNFSAIIEDGAPPVSLKHPEVIPEEIKKILDTILPPREFEEDDINWIQHVCKDSADRSQVIGLRDLLEDKLIQRQARQDGICQVRRELYSQCFDEIIRQTTILCLERGLILLRIRDEFRMTLHACMTLFEQSTNNGFKRSIQYENEKKDMVHKISSLEYEIKSIKSEVNHLEKEVSLLEKSSKKSHDQRKKVMKESADSLNKANLQLKHQIEAILSNKDR